MSAAIPREAALRIALAARALPGVNVPTLLEILHDRLSHPLDLEKLSRITVTDLKTGFASLDGEEDGEDVREGVEPYKLAVRILWGEVQQDEDLPSTELYTDGDMPGSIRIAVASNSGELLDGHFGSCLRFLIYQLSPTEVRLIDIRSAAEADVTDDRNLARAQIASDCQIMMVVSIGGPAAAKVVKQGLFPLKRIDGGPARDAVESLQPMLLKPPPWLAKILGVAADQRLKTYRGRSDDEESEDYI